MKSMNTHNKNDNKGNNENNENNDNNKNSENWLGFSLSQPSLSNPTTFFNFPSQFNYQNMYSDGNEGGIYPAFPVMPLKSDGSLCLMDAITRSQSQEMAASTTPKLEKFFGSATMVAPEFDNTMYYQQYQIQPQNYQDYSALRGLYPTVQQEEAKESHFGADSTYGLYLPTIGEADITGAGAGTGAGGLSLSLETKKRGSEKMGQNKQIIHRKSLDTFGQRTSQYRGVTRHRWTGRYEAHLWDNTCKKEGQTRKGRQVYLGGYDMEDKAARAYDLAALKYWGPSTHINFLLENYEQELEEMKNMSRQEYVAHLRRRSSGFSRGASVYRGVTRHHQHGRWQARIGRVAGNKDLYLGTFGTQEDAAEAYDVAAIKFRGLNAVTNFDISRYHVERIMASDTLLAGDLAKRTKEVEPTNEVLLNPAYDGEPKTSLSETTTNGNMLDWKMSVYDPNPRCALEGDGSAKIVSHLSNGGSSVVTSLSSSPSPERDNNLPLALGTQARAQIPIFAAWTDA